MRVFLVSLALLMFTVPLACAPTVQVKPIDAAQPQSSRVFVTEQSLPQSAYEPIAEIKNAGTVARTESGC